MSKVRKKELELPTLRVAEALLGMELATRISGDQPLENESIQYARSLTYQSGLKIVGRSLVVVRCMTSRIVCRELVSNQKLKEQDYGSSLRPST